MNSDTTKLNRIMKNGTLIMTFRYKGTDLDIFKCGPHYYLLDWNKKVYYSFDYKDLEAINGLLMTRGLKFNK